MRMMNGGEGAVAASPLWNLRQMCERAIYRPAAAIKGNQRLKANERIPYPHKLIPRIGVTACTCGSNVFAPFQRNPQFPLRPRKLGAVVFAMPAASSIARR